MMTIKISHLHVTAEGTSAELAEVIRSLPISLASAFEQQLGPANAAEPPALPPTVTPPPQQFHDHATPAKAASLPGAPRASRHPSRRARPAKEPGRSLPDDPRVLRRLRGDEHGGGR